MFNIAICDDDTFFIDYIEKVIVEVNGSDKDINFYEYTKGKVFLWDVEDGMDIDLLILDIKLDDAAREAGNGHICVNQIGSLMSVFFTDQKVRDFESAVTSNTEQYADYFGYLLDRGIYIAPSQFETMFISNAHTEEDIEKTCKLAGEALCSLDF